MAPKTKAERHEHAKDRINAMQKADKPNRSSALNVLKFLHVSQWDDQEKNQRKRFNQVCLEINVLYKYVAQVVGEMRQNKVRIKVVPANNKADLVIAKIREGLIYNIEYQSNAESIYDHAANMLVQCGYGAWRILTRYVQDSENPFLQEIYLQRIQNPLSVFMDDEAEDPCYADARDGCVFDRISRDDYKEKYGEDKVPGGADGKQIEMPINGSTNEGWWDKDSIRVVDYYYTAKESQRWCLLEDGRYMTDEDYKAESEQWIAQGLTEDQLPKIKEKRDVDTKKIKFIKLSATEILEESDWAGSFIPIILVTGDETNIDGKRVIKGLLHNAVDPQKMLNYWHSAVAERIAMAPKSQWLLTAKMIEKHEREWGRSHEENLPFLIYTPDPDAPEKRPVRVDPGQVNPGFFTEIARAEENIKSCIGMYNADIGDQGREVSGVAIRARQTPGDTGTFIYPDNMVRARRQSGIIINDLLGKIYETDRDVAVKSFDDSESFAPVNMPASQALEEVSKAPDKYRAIDKNKLEKLAKDAPNSTFNDMTEGKYEINIVQGAAYQTQRQEAAEMMLKIATVGAKMNPIDKYFTVKNMDFYGADEYADTVRRMIPPNIMPPKEGDKPMPPAPPSPQVMIAQTKMQTEQVKGQRETVKLRIDLLKLLHEMRDEKTEVRQEILKTLAELHSSEPPSGVRAMMPEQAGVI